MFVTPSKVVDDLASWAEVTSQPTCTFQSATDLVDGLSRADIESMGELVVIKGVRAAPQLVENTDGDGRLSHV